MWVKVKVNIFWENHNILRNLHQVFDWQYTGQIIGGDFVAFSEYIELYTVDIIGNNMLWVHYACLLFAFYVCKVFKNFGLSVSPLYKLLDTAAKCVKSSRCLVVFTSNRPTLFWTISSSYFSFFWQCVLLHISMTSLLMHTVAHSTSIPLGPKLTTSPLKSF